MARGKIQGLHTVVSVAAAAATTRGVLTPVSGAWGKEWSPGSDANSGRSSLGLQGEVRQAVAAATPAETCKPQATRVGWGMGANPCC